jgi:hypothetical protein
MGKIKSIISKEKENLMKEVSRLEMIESVYNWVISELNITFDHQDIRGGYNIILGSPMVDEFEKINLSDLERKFKNQPFYREAKENLISIGYILRPVRKERVMVYIQTNKDLLKHKDTVSEIRDTILARVNREMFPHIDEYFK